MAACGSDSDKDTSATVAKKKAIGKLGVNLRVINEGPATMRIVICGADDCKPGRFLKTGEVEDMSASSVHGWYFYERPGPSVADGAVRGRQPGVGVPLSRSATAAVTVEFLGGGSTRRRATGWREWAGPSAGATPTSLATSDLC